MLTFCPGASHPDGRASNLTGDAGGLEGGVPVIVDAKLIGAIGISGVTSQQDAQVAQAGAAAGK